MKRAAGIITDHGGNTSHAAIVSRELGVPAVVGTGNATTALSQDQDITLSCASGEKGMVYEGLLDFESEEVDLGSLPETTHASHGEYRRACRPRSSGGASRRKAWALPGWNSSSTT